jgi:hypothetical protein
MGDDGSAGVYRTGRGRLALRGVVDWAYDLDAVLRRSKARVDRLVWTTPRRRVLVIGVYGPAQVDTMRAACSELLTSRHDVDIWLGSSSGDDWAIPELTRVAGMSGGRTENLNALWRAWGEENHGAPDWTLLLDDDVRLPRRFLDRFLALCEHFELKIAQPAMLRRSHASWPVTRRQRASLVRETRFVETGPCVVFAREAAARLLPQPHSGYGWGLDRHWPVVAEHQGWRMGVVDATPFLHERPPATGSRSAERELFERFLASHPHIQPEEARTLRTHRRLDV